MIALFAAIMLVNTLIAATTYRRREFGQQRLAGATRGQVLRMVGVEGVVLAVTGVLFGALASLAASCRTASRGPTRRCPTRRC